VPAQEHGLALGGCVLKPKSRGYVAIASPDPTAKPIIVHNYLTEQQDVDSALAGLRMTMEILRAAPLAGHIDQPASAPDGDSDAALLAHMRRNAFTLYHPVGTCRMGGDEGSVVDPELRVRGTEGLRVVDASVMPTVPHGNTNAPVIALAETAADLIRGRAPAREGEAAEAAA
jgi:choline dehydrogenase-like flavoprotein